MNYELKIRNYGEEKVAKKHQKIYSFGKSSNSPGSFAFKKNKKN